MNSESQVERKEIEDKRLRRSSCSCTVLLHAIHDGDDEEWKPVHLAKSNAIYRKSRGKPLVVNHVCLNTLQLTTKAWIQRQIPPGYDHADYLHVPDGRFVFGNFRLGGDIGENYPLDIAKSDDAIMGVVRQWAEEAPDTSGQLSTVIQRTIGWKAVQDELIEWVHKGEESSSAIRASVREGLTRQVVPDELIESAYKELESSFDIRASFQEQITQLMKGPLIASILPSTDWNSWKYMFEQHDVSWLPSWMLPLVVEPCLKRHGLPCTPSTQRWALRKALEAYGYHLKIDTPPTRGYLVESLLLGPARRLSDQGKRIAPDYEKKRPYISAMTGSGGVLTIVINPGIWAPTNKDALNRVPQIMASHVRWWSGIKFARVPKTRLTARGPTEDKITDLIRQYHHGDFELDELEDKVLQLETSLAGVQQLPWQVVDEIKDKLRKRLSRAKKRP